MLAKARTCAVVGLDGALVEVEVDIGHGLPAFSIVGLPDAAVNEAKERVRAAIKNSGAIFPLRRITVNLAPADLRKAGPAYDLPIAIAHPDGLGAGGPAQRDWRRRLRRSDCLFLGELSLDGGLRHTHGILPMVALARERRHRGGLRPGGGRGGGGAGRRTSPSIPSSIWRSWCAHLRGDAAHRAVSCPMTRRWTAGDDTVYPFDLADVRGQEHVKRALEVAASGGHNLLMVGPPGSGKTLLARTLPSILPPLTLDEALEVTQDLQRQRACSAPIGR